LALRICASCAHLLHLPQSVYELLEKSEVRAQPPEGKNQQQGHQSNNYQVLQITSSALWEFLVRGSLRLTAILSTAAAFFTPVRQVILATPGKSIDIPTPGR